MPVAYFGSEFLHLEVYGGRVTPDDLRTAAHQLRHYAEQLAVSLDPVASRAGVDAWIGPAADEFRHELNVHHSNVRSLALAVKALARRIDARATAVENQILEQRLLAEARAEAKPMP